MEASIRKISVRDGVGLHMDENDRPTFERWMERINAVLLRCRGIDLRDMPDIDYRKLYDRRIRPIHAANAVIRAAM